MPTPSDYLREHSFAALFTEYLGWDRSAGTLRLGVGDRAFELTSVVQKRGLQVLCCGAEAVVLVNRGLLRNVQRLVRKTYHEHILIFHLTRSVRSRQKTPTDNSCA
jgi:hypothetical protein